MSDHNLAEALRLIAWSNDSAWQAQCAREALAAHEAEHQAGEAVAYALLFPGDPRLCLSTVFDTYPEAINYAVTRVSGPVEIVPLFTHPQQPLTDRQLRTILTGSPTGYITDTVRGIAVDVQNALLGITKDTK